MTAYELAEWLNDWTDSKPYPKQNQLIVEMLKMQADEIKALREQLIELQ
jgi:lambda repressor-like predicted transcriptional regulator